MGSSGIGRCSIIGSVMATLAAVCLLCGCNANKNITSNQTVTPAIPSEFTIQTSTPEGILTSTPYPTFTPNPTPEPDVLVVDVARLLGEVNPFVYGSNTGPWQTITKSDKDLIKQAGITILRFPGGNYVDENAPSRSAVDEFIVMCREIGVEPMVQVKLVNSTPQAAADMVVYANITKGYAIRYWSIGNEPSLYWGNRGIAQYDTKTFNAEWREYARAMKAIDPSILILGPEIHQYTGLIGDAIVDIHYKDWMKEFLLANGDLVDIVAFHRYPFGNFDPFPNELLRSSEEWDKIIPDLKYLIKSTTGRDIPIAITEVNSNWSNRSREETTPDTLLNAIWWADALGRMIGQNLEIVNQFAVDGNGGWALLGSQQPKPAYYVYLIYQNFGEQLVYSSSGVKQVSIFASLHQDGSLALIFVNRNSSPVKVNLDIRNFEPGITSQWTLLDENHLAVEIPSHPISPFTTFTLPSLSVLSTIVEPGK